MENFKIDKKYLEEKYMELDYESRVVILDADCFNAEYQNPMYHVATAEGGFGCSPSSLGRAVFITYLSDYERGRKSRADVIGVIKKELEPEFVKKFCDYRDKMQENKPMGLSLEMIEAFNNHMKKENSNIRYVKKSSDIYDNYELSILEPFLEIYTPMKIVPPHFVDYIRSFFKNNFGVEDTGYTNTVHTVVLKDTPSQGN